jgi:predicted DNA-binding WGR domain protein
VSARRSEAAAKTLPLFQPAPAAPHDFELRLIDPDRNMRRFWGCTEARTHPHGGFALESVWGRIGSPMRRRIEVFPSREALLGRRDKMIRRKEARGYSLGEGLIFHTLADGRLVTVPGEVRALRETRTEPPQVPPA